VASRLPTICCSALALITSCTLLAADRNSNDTSLFPTRVLWTLALNSRLTSAPAYDGPRAYFPIDGDRLVAYDLRTGHQLWMVPAKHLSRPVAGDGMIFSVDETGITARRAEDGLEAWKVPIGEPIAAELTWESGWLVAGTASGSVLAFRAHDGELIWRAHLEAPLHAPATLGGERVYLPVADGHVVALRLDTGAPLWKFRLGDAPNDILALATRIYVGSNDKYFYCMNAETGERIFRWPTGADVIGRPITIDRRVFFASLDNFLYALDARSGSQQWSANLPTRPVRGASQAGDAVLVSGLGSIVQGFRAKNGERLGDISLGGPIAAPPAFIADPELPFPMFLIVSHEIEKGATVTAYARTLEIPQLPFARVTDLIAKTLGVTPMKPEQK